LQPVVKVVQVLLVLEVVLVVTQCMVVSLLMVAQVVEHIVETLLIIRVWMAPVMAMHLDLVVQVRDLQQIQEEPGEHTEMQVDRTRVQDKVTNLHHAVVGVGQAQQVEMVLQIAPAVQVVSEN
jgi:hypothetical protein